jgi:hypothetical protein
MPKLNQPQAQFLALDRKFKAFVAGFGSGKTWVGTAGICQHMWEHPRVNAGYFAPTYGQIRDIFYPTIEETAFDWGLKCQIREANREVHLFSGRDYRATVLCRSMDKPGEIVGFKIGHALIDELDLMRKDKAQTAWRKIIARMRYNLPNLRNGIDVTTTPEGFKFVYEQFVKALREKPSRAKMYGLVQASTYQNAKNLPFDYIPSLLESYPPQLIEAYLRGQFVNLLSGAVYPGFHRALNHTFASIQPGEPLHIGMDFNVLHMAAVVFVVRDNQPYALDELTEVRDTPTMARLLTERYPGHAITIYPDASGQNTSSKNASESDLSILRIAKFTVRVNSTNPAVKDRVNAVNAQIYNGLFERRMLVNTLRCPRYTEALEQQPYDLNGEPDKTTGHDHVNDAGGYFIVKTWPIVRNLAATPARITHMNR